MDINASIVDQRLSSIIQQHQSLLTPIVGNDKERQRSLAFVLLCVSVVLDTPLEESAELLTEGGNDFGADALHLES